MLELGPWPRVGAHLEKDWALVYRFCCTSEEVNLFQQAFHWGDSGIGLAWVLVPLAGHVGAVGPWVGKVVVHQFQSLAMLEDAVDGHDFRSGFAQAAGLAAIAAVGEHMHQSAPMHRPGGLGGVAGPWGMGGLKALHDHLHCSEGTPQEDIQDLLDSVDQDNDDVDADVDVESVAAQTAHCSALLDSPG